MVWVKMTYFHRFFRTIPGVLVTKRKYQKYVAWLKKSKGGVEQPAYYIISIVISIFVKMFEHYFHLFHNFKRNAIHGKDDSS